VKKKRLLVIGGIAVLIIIGLIVVPLIIDVNTYKPRAEAVLSNALGMEVKIQGDMHIVLLPDFSVSLENVSVRGKDSDLCIAKKAKIDLDLWSVMQDEVNILAIDLVTPTFNIVKNQDGVFNFEKPGEPLSITLPYIEKFSISKGDVIYLDEKDEDKVMISRLDLTLADVSFDKSGDTNLLQKISFYGNMKAEKLESKEYEISNVDFDVKARKGVFELHTVSKADIVYLDEKTRDKVMVNGIELALADISFEENSNQTFIRKISFDGDMKAEKLESREYQISRIDLSVKARKGVFELLSKSKGDVVHQDEQTKAKVMVNGIDLALAEIAFEENSEHAFMRKISFDGTVKAEQIKSEEYEISNIDLRLKARKGVFELLTVSKGDIVYVDKKTKDKVMVNGLDLALSNVSIHESGDNDLIKKISFDGDVNIEKFDEETYKLSDLSFRTKARKGVFELRSISTSDLHGKEEDSVTIDLTGKIPSFKIKYTESGLPVEEMLRRLYQKEVLKGEIDLAINLSMKGKSLAEMKRTLDGDVSIKGEGLIFHGLDIDDVISKFERSQQFDLLDVGSTFFLGPFGPAITKGSQFAQVYSALQKEKDSEIQKLICSWDMKNGVAEAKDVALSTEKNRIAMVGKLDLVNEQFLDVTIAVLDSKGCAVVSQEIQGSFINPEIKKMSTIGALMGPVVGVLNNTTKMLLMKKCKVFYKGSLEHPKEKKKGLL
jgi:hypothetical protein